VGKVIVGNGGPQSEVVDEPETTDDEESSTPSIGILVSVIAMIGISLLARRL